MLRLCLGCGRSLDEIARWSRLTEEQREAVIDQLDTRMEHLKPQRRAAGLDGFGDQ